MKTNTYYVDTNCTEFSMIKMIQGKNDDIFSLLVQIRGKEELKFKTSEGVDEFCELLQQKKNEIWNDKELEVLKDSYEKVNNTLKVDIINSIKEAWDNSKIGSYMEQNRPQWLIDITPDNFHSLNGIANNAADKILQKLIKNK